MIEIEGKCGEYYLHAGFPKSARKSPSLIGQFRSKIGNIQPKAGKLAQNERMVLPQMPLIKALRKEHLKEVLKSNRRLDMGV
ncbi:MAG: hypothetical protein SCAL_000065 [Candidatus Syntrophoarchaeum caldarius]|uniref:Uncharacterized protein n=1 Tax=Candidatus Syntropharchaeum caldarium TaxID=1838285 RepID=A0A1F2PAG0_9EURY|nr:MAG: hypothetical protein SCAL_000065 [Candidatus Syntrophoarchaeum caldarius]